MVSTVSTRLAIASLTLAALAAVSACSGVGRRMPPPPAPPRFPALDYPPTRAAAVTDDYHGVEVADPYRWLEDQDAEEVAGWVQAQNAVTEAFLASIPEREALRRRVEELWAYPRRSAPSRHGTHWVWTRNDGLQDQSVVVAATAPDAEPRVLLDPNELSDDGTVALGGASFSEDGALLAYALSEAGSDWREWRVLRVADGKVLDDHVRWTKFTRAAWTHDGEGFFYQRFPEPPAGKAYEAINRQPQLCYHRLGTPQSDDRVVYERPDQPGWGFAATVGDGGRYLVITISQGTDERNRIAYVDLDDDAWDVVPLFMDGDAAHDYLGNDGGKLYFRTDRDAPRGRIVAIDLTDPLPASWTELVPQHAADTLQSAKIVGDSLILTYLRDATHAVRVHALDGTFAQELALPGPGSVGGFTGDRDDRVAHVAFSSFTDPGSIWRLDLDSGAFELFHETPVRFDPRPLVTRQVFLQSPDGTRLPMFLVHRCGIALDGSNPTYLYGYGGFNISLTPSFSPDRIAWLERGGVYAQPTLRGGGEYGEAWHRGGMLESKQKVFDDFLAAAHYLIRNGYTSPPRLAIGGRSNGGLLVGAVMTQAPELFGAAVPEVGVMDMLRYHEFTIGWAWAPEYGRSDDPEMFPVLHAYSPLHNLEGGVAYPATLVMTGDHDDRVLPGHSYKFAARLQQVHAGDAPVLIRIATRAGHGAGTPVSERIAAAADRWAFLLRCLGASGG